MIHNEGGFSRSYPKQSTSGMWSGVFIIIIIIIIIIIFVKNS